MQTTSVKIDEDVYQDLQRVYNELKTAYDKLLAVQEVQNLHRKWMCVIVPVELCK